ncbi:hypothetical protein [Rhodococcus sp. IEGM 1330]|nr:hypothetical protein [Rhodococcus sp. IEGM 1330]MDV8024482.1 hypothetical protein [Rhodococcus sp. IEGM 1330]
MEYARGFERPVDFSDTVVASGSSLYVAITSVLILAALGPAFT